MTSAVFTEGSRLRVYRSFLRQLAPLTLGLSLVACGGDGASGRETGDTAQKGADADTSGGGAAAAVRTSQDGKPACDPGNGGLTLPEGFCALVVAEGVGSARHIAVAPDGDLYVALRGGRGGTSGVLALRDTTGDGKADVREGFGKEGGTGLAFADGQLYFAPDAGVLRWRLPEGRLVPEGSPETLIKDLPDDGDHEAKSIALDGKGALFVNIGSATNSCQERNRVAGSPGQDPCSELERHAGIWRFDANRAGQTFAEGERFATGLRNTVALAVDPQDGVLYGVFHGRDQLAQNWPDLFTPRQSAEKPSEEFVQIQSGDDFGWPYCYHDPELGQLVLAPEYGGDGKEAGRCAEKKEPLLGFPAHWGPMAILFYAGEQFPKSYQGGAFVAFHGSWNRAPLPQQGFNVTFVPMRGGRPAGEYVVFADGFAGPGKDAGNALHRPAGLAQGPDGSLYVSDDVGGTIWRILYTGTSPQGEAGAS